MTEIVHKNLLTRLFSILKTAIKGDDSFNYTTESITKGVLLLAIPMVLEMMMESVFALVDLYFVGHLENSSYAIQTVGLTESILTIIYSLAIGISMAATAVVARRIGEKNPEAAAKSGAQAILLAVVINTILSIFGVFYAGDILLLLGASPEAVVYGKSFTQLMLASSISIMLLFLINGIFRGAGNAAIAMRSLWIANGCNIILCPILINGLGPIPAFGLVGAAMATTIGRSLGVLYQFIHLFGPKGIIQVKLSYYIPNVTLLKDLTKIAAPGVLQFVIASCSWIFLAQLVATTGGDLGSAGYQTALRIMMFFILPAWGLSNAAATLVGQNLGANKIDRAELSVYTTAKYNSIFMACIMVICLVFGDPIISFFTNDTAVKTVAKEALQIMSLGYIFYGIGMVLINTFNGAGDTWTPTKINFFGFWLFQIPLAYLLAKQLHFGPTGVFMAIPIAETAITLTSIFWYRKGKWKNSSV